MIFKDHLFGERVPLMSKALGAYSLRQQVASRNIANADSPHFRPEAVKFEELFDEGEVVLSGAQSEGESIPIGRINDEAVSAEKTDAAVPEPEIYFSGETHVNIDKEMSALAQNQIKYRFASQMMGKYFKGLSSSITGSGNY
ncbi:MAG: flagellar basal body rod protein FlgB [Chloroflexota bacterium]